MRAFCSTVTLAALLLAPPGLNGDDWFGVDEARTPLASPADVVQEFLIRRALIEPLYPYDLCRFVQSVEPPMLASLDAFPAGFRNGLAAVDRGGLTVYPVTCIQVRDFGIIAFVNATGTVFATALYSDGGAWSHPSWVEADYLPFTDPARVGVTLYLVTVAGLAAADAAAELQAEIDAQNAPAEGTGDLLRGGLQGMDSMQNLLDATYANLTIAGVQATSDGVDLTIGLPTGWSNRLDVMVSDDLSPIPIFWRWRVTLDEATNGLSFDWVDTNSPAIDRTFWVLGNADIDSDGDGIPDAQESYVMRTSPTNSDTDGDGMADGWEVVHGHDPLDPDDPPNLRGTIGYVGGQTGVIRVLALSDPNSWATNDSRTIPGPGAYLIPNLTGTNYWIKAFMDSDGNGSNGSAEAWGIYSTNVIVITNMVTGADFALTDPDLDADGMSDWWEIAMLGSTNASPSADADGDGYTNLEEYRDGTNPTNAVSHLGTLGGMVVYTGPQTGVIRIVASATSNSWVGVASVTNSTPSAFLLRHLPTNSDYWVKAWRDTCTDGTSQTWEAWGACTNNPIHIGASVTNLILIISDPDTDGDGMPDWWEILHGLSPTDPSDAVVDVDGDGYLNVYEYKYGTDPQIAASMPTGTVIAAGTTIQAAINAVTNDYAILVLTNAVYANVGDCNLRFYGKRLMLTSPGGASNTAISCGATNGSHRRGLLFVDGESQQTVVRGLTVLNGQYPSWEYEPGGGILCSNASPTLVDCVVSNCESARGGGLAVIAGAAPNIVRCRFTRNGKLGVGDGGNVYVDNAYPQFSGCTIEANDDGYDGAGYGFAEYGGGVSLSFGSGPAPRAVVFSNCVIRNNTASLYGGGVSLSDAVGTPVVFVGCTITNNVASDFMHGMYTYSAGGGGLDLSANAKSFGTVLTNCLIAWNYADAQFFNGSLGDGGGGLYVAGNVQLDSCVIASNRVYGGYGAGATLCSYTNVAPCLAACQVLGNVVTNGGSGAGVAVFRYSGWPSSSLVTTTTIARTTVSGNSGADDGGGLFLSGDLFDPAVAVWIEACYFLSNQCRTNGGAIFITSTNRIDIQNCTILSNSFGGTFGSLAASGGSNLFVRNTVLWGNGAKSISLNNALATVTYSCIDHGYAGIGNTTNDPQLVQGYRLRTPGSPCVGNGVSNGVPAVDLDGYGAAAGARPDIGCSFFRVQDTDGDGMDDTWEMAMFGTTNRNGTGDYDLDGATDAQEFADGTNAARSNANDLVVWQMNASRDSDGDGMPDGWEGTHGLNPLADDSKADNDGDGISNEKEWLWGTNPSGANGLDSDGDGISDADELSGAVTGVVTDPANADTDGDGVPDGQDSAPLDPTVWQDPNDPGPLVLVIVQPSEGAEL